MVHYIEGELSTIGDLSDTAVLLNCLPGTNALSFMHALCINPNALSLKLN